MPKRLPKDLLAPLSDTEWAALSKTSGLSLNEDRGLLDELIIIYRGSRRSAQSQTRSAPARKRLAEYEKHVSHLARRLSRADVEVVAAFRRANQDIENSGRRFQAVAAELSAFQKQLRKAGEKMRPASPGPKFDHLHLVLMSLQYLLVARTGKGLTLEKKRLQFVYEFICIADWPLSEKTPDVKIRSSIKNHLHEFKDMTKAEAARELRMVTKDTHSFARAYSSLSRARRSKL